MVTDVILSPLEQEYLLRAVESSLRVRDRHGLFLWAQGQLQGLLPHQVLLCVECGADGQLRRVEAVYGALPAAAQAHLADPKQGLACVLAHAWATGWRLPASVAVSRAGAECHPAAQALADAGFDNLLIHASTATGCGVILFALLGMPMRPGPRPAYFLELVLPQLHFALLRAWSGISAQAGRRCAGTTGEGAGPARNLSAREAEILGWVREGKSNYEIACILGISALTVKNHLQRIYRTLGVSNRTHAMTRCTDLGLLAAAGSAAAL